MEHCKLPSCHTITAQAKVLFYGHSCACAGHCSFPSWLVLFLTWPLLLQADHTPEIREAQLKAKKLAETMAKAPPGWQAQQNTAYLPNGELNPLVVAAQQAAQKLAQQVRLSSKHELNCSDDITFLTSKILRLGLIFCKTESFLLQLGLHS